MAARSARAVTLANRFEGAVAEFIRTVEGLTETQWRTLCPNEERSVGVLSRHVAAAIPFEMTFFRAIAAGRQPATISNAEVDEENARDAEKWADCAKAETLTLLRSNAAAVADEVRHLSEEQLARTGKYLTDLPEAWTVEQWLERMLISHVLDHLESIRAMVSPQGKH